MEGSEYVSTKTPIVLCPVTRLLRCETTTGVRYGTAFIVI